MLGVPVMSKASFINRVGHWWKEKLAESMTKAGMEKKQLAEKRSDYHEEVPAITFKSKLH